MTMLNYIVNLLTVKAILVGLIFGVLLYRLGQRLLFKLPPGPFALPLVGNLLQFKTDKVHEQLFEWSKKFGPIISVYIGPALVIVVNDVDSAMEVLVNKGPDFAGRPSSPSQDIITECGQDIAFGQYSLTWKLHRKIATKALTHYMLGDKLQERVHKAISVTFEKLKKEKNPFDPTEHLDFLIAHILYGVCFNDTNDFNDAEITTLVKLENDLINIVFNGIGVLEDRIPGLQYLWETKRMKRLKRTVDKILNIFTAKYKQHRETFNKDNIRDFTDTLILARQETSNDNFDSNNVELSDTYIIQILKDIFFGGIITSRHSLRYAVLHMVAYPEIQTKVQEEIDKVVGFAELPKICHRSQLSYTEAVLHESLRLSSVSPTGLPHMAIRDATIQGYDVPKNTMVIINHWALHHDPSLWRNVNDFVPERFLDKDGRMAPKPDAWLSFSAGIRACLGQSVAKAELHLLFAALMQKFTWRIAEGEQIDLTPDGNMFALFPKSHDLIVEERKW